MSFVKWCELCETKGIWSPVCLFQINFTEALQMCKRPECLDLVLAKDFHSLIVQRNVLGPEQKNPIPQTSIPPENPKQDDASASTGDCLEGFLASFDAGQPSTSQDNCNSAVVAPPNLLPQNKELEAHSKVPVSAPNRISEEDTTCAKESFAAPLQPTAQEGTPSNNSRETLPDIKTAMDTSADERTNAASPNTAARELEEHSYTKPARLQSEMESSHHVKSAAAQQVSTVSSSEDSEEQGRVAGSDVYASAVPVACNGFGFKDNCEGRDEIGFDIDCAREETYDIQGYSESIYGQVFAQGISDSDKDSANIENFCSPDDAVSSCLRIADSISSINDTVVHRYESCNNDQYYPGTNDHFILEMGASVDVVHQTIDKSSPSLTAVCSSHKESEDHRAAEDSTTQFPQSADTNVELATSNLTLISDIQITLGPSSSVPNSDVAIPAQCGPSVNSQNLASALSAAKLHKTAHDTNEETMPADTTKSRASTCVSVESPTAVQKPPGVTKLQSGMVLVPLRNALATVPTGTIIEYHTPKGLSFSKKASDILGTGDVPVSSSAAGPSTQPGSKAAPKRKLPEELSARSSRRPQSGTLSNAQSGLLIVSKLAKISNVLKNAKSQAPLSDPPRVAQTLSATKKIPVSSRKPRKARKRDQSVAPKKTVQQQHTAHRTAETSLPDFSASLRSPVNSENGSSSSKQSSGSDGTQGSRCSPASSALGANVSSSAFVRMVKDKVQARKQSGSGFSGYHPILAKKPQYVEEGRTTRRSSKKIADGASDDLARELDSIVSKGDTSLDNSEFESILGELFSMV